MKFAVKRHPDTMHPLWSDFSPNPLLLRLAEPANSIDDMHVMWRDVTPAVLSEQGCGLGMQKLPLLSPSLWSLTTEQQASRDRCTRCNEEGMSENVVLRLQIEIPTTILTELLAKRTPTDRAGRARSATYLNHDSRFLRSRHCRGRQ